MVLEVIGARRAVHPSNGGPTTRHLRRRVTGSRKIPFLFCEIDLNQFRRSDQTMPLSQEVVAVLAGVVLLHQQFPRRTPMILVQS
jgi:hypothetical protein